MTKIDIISGFLGAGKTTLIKKLLSEALTGEKTMLIENEFGEIGIDGGFLKESGIQITEMNSGCICCSLVGDFEASLKEAIATYHPDRIMIEPSGVGKLSDVIRAAHTAESEPGVVLNSATVVADAMKVKMYSKNFGEFYNNQIEYAGAIILSRTDRISEEKLAGVISLLREHNKTAAIVTTPWNLLNGSVLLSSMEGGRELFGQMEAALLKEVEEEHEHEHEHHHHHEHDEHEHEHNEHDEHEHDEHEHEHHHEHHYDENGVCSCGHHHGHDHHHADEVFESWGMETAASYTRDKLTEKLNALQDEESCGMILRAKGMVASPKEGEWLYFDYVPGEIEIRTGAPDITGKICVIGSKMKESAIASIFGR